MKHSTLIALAIIVLVAALSGCATAPPAKVSTEQTSIEDTPPVCTSDRQCAAMWDAARVWVKSAYCGCGGIKTMTDSYIATCDSVGNDPALACSVTKVPKPEGGYSFVAKAHCANWFRCSPPAIDAVHYFNSKVTQAGTTTGQ
jgi:hypothetical protein